MSKGLFVSLSALCLLSLVVVAAMPAGAQPGEPLEVRDHVIVISRAGPDADVGVRENVYLQNTGETDYQGAFWIDLHPAVTGLTHYWHDSTGARFEGDAGVPSRDPLPNETVDGHVRHTMDLAERNVMIAPGATVILVLEYLVDADAPGFTRGFTVPTQRIALEMADIPGLFPQSQETPLEPVRSPHTGAWMYQVAPGARGPFDAGQAFAFTWEQTQDPLEPLRVEVQVVSQDPIRLRAVSTGGIGDIDYNWDLTGDGVCDDHEGQEVDVPVDDAAVTTVTVCATDARTPPGEARQSFAARAFDVDAAWDGPSPWLLLVLGVLGGGFLVFALTQGGFLAAGRRGTVVASSIGAESAEMLEMRRRVMVAALKELEIAKKKGEVPEAQYTSLKSELKKDTVAVMRELERRKTEKETV